ncbi:MAG: YwiC-like family protein [Acidobacteriota bacterium]
MATNVQTLRPSPTIRVRQIALPTEHGGWGFLLEPMVAGLAIAFSLGGIWISVMFIGAFLMRQPLKIYILDRRGMCDDRRAAVSMKYMLIYGAVLLSGVIGTALTCSLTTILPLIAMLPLAALQNYYDIFRRSRNLVPELAGAVAISSSVAAIALAGGRTPVFAAGLWVVFIGRLIPSIIYVRERLLLEKGKAFSGTVSNLLHVIAAAIVGVLAVAGVVPVLTFPVMILMLVRAVLGLSPHRAKLKAKQIGIREVIYGTVLVLAVILGYFLGL